MKRLTNVFKIWVLLLFIAVASVVLNPSYAQPTSTDLLNMLHNQSGTPVVFRMPELTAAGLIGGNLVNPFNNTTFNQEDRVFATLDFTQNLNFNFPTPPPINETLESQPLELEYQSVFVCDIESAAHLAEWGSESLRYIRLVDGAWVAQNYDITVIIVGISCNVNTGIPGSYQIIYTYEIPETGDRNTHVRPVNVRPSQNDIISITAAIAPSPVILGSPLPTLTVTGVLRGGGTRVLATNEFTSSPAIQTATIGTFTVNVQLNAGINSDGSRPTASANYQVIHNVNDIISITAQISPNPVNQGATLPTLTVTGVLRGGGTRVLAANEFTSSPAIQTATLGTFTVNVQLNAGINSDGSRPTANPTYTVIPVPVPPTITQTIVSPTHPGTTWLSSPAGVRITVTDPVDNNPTIRYCVSASGTCTPTTQISTNYIATLSGTSANFNVCVSATNRDGLTASGCQEYRVDGEPPNGTCVDNGPWSNTTSTVNCTSSDVGSGVRLTEWSTWANRNNLVWPTFNNSFVTNSHANVVYIEDMVGNWRTIDATARIDYMRPWAPRVDPVVTMNDPLIQNVICDRTGFVAPFGGNINCTVWALRAPVQGETFTISLLLQDHDFTPEYTSGISGINRLRVDRFNNFGQFLGTATHPITNMVVYTFDDNYRAEFTAIDEAGNVSNYRLIVTYRLIG